ncbi:MAG TPA: hypothetical protein VKI64_10310 [Acidimicrobiales bacterium]|nr:hypothetical protein [Acidimicrobiales bacterium]
MEPAPTAVVEPAPAASAFVPSRPAGAEPARWSGIAFSSALGIAVVQAIVVVGVILEGLAVSSQGTQGLRGDVFYRIGLAAYIPNLTATNGLLLILAVGLVLLPVATRTRVGPTQRSTALVTLVAVTILAVLTGVGGLLAVRAQFHRFDLFHQKIDSVSRRLLFTYLAGTLGTAAVAVAAAIGAIGLYRRAGGTGQGLEAEDLEPEETEGDEGEAETEAAEAPA